MNKTKYFWAGAALVAVSAAVPAMTASAGPGPDTVIGVFTADDPSDVTALDAFSTHKGLRPGGTVFGEEGVLGAGGIYTLERVVCLAVEGNRATISTRIISTNIESTPVGTFQQYHVIDNAAEGTPDLVGGGWSATRPSCEVDHSDPPAGYGTVSAGDITVTDH